jgi:hypothetical protein
VVSTQSTTRYRWDFFFFFFFFLVLEVLTFHTSKLTQELQFAAQRFTERKTKLHPIKQVQIMLQNIT